MATATEARIGRRPPGGNQWIVIDGIDWETYRRFTDAIGDQAIRVAYDQGVLELMSPGPVHEFDKKLIGRLVEIITEELEIPCVGMGSTRWEREEALKGSEPDECYYFEAEKIAARAAAQHSNKSKDYPMPDLAIEVDLSSSSVDRLGIYASFGIPEVWRFDDGVLFLLRLRDDGTYESRPDSSFLPIRPEEVIRWVVDEDSADQSAWARRLRAWTRTTLGPRPR